MRLRLVAAAWPLALMLLPSFGGLAVAAPAATPLVPGATQVMARPVPPAAHHAIYSLSLERSPGDDVTAAHGTMAYEVTDACEGWATQQRLEMTITNRDGQDVTMVSDYATWESKDGARMRFTMRQTTDGAVTDHTAGSATLDGPGGAGVVHYTEPAKAEVALPKGTLFPMAHTETILRAAAAGEKFLALPIFDGTGSKGAQDSSIVVLGWGPPGSSPGSAPYPALSALPSGRVTIAFFDGGKRQDGTPDYQVGMRYWANGVADDLHMNFSTFEMQGKLVQFGLEKPHC